VTARKARLDLSLDGVTLTRSESHATRRGAAQRIHVGWDEVAGAEVETTKKGRAVVRVRVSGAPDIARHQDDPYAVKVPRNQTETARRIVQQINDEVSARRRWRQHAGS